MDLSLFCGRETELTTLRQWVLEKHCGLLTVLEIGGIGKSALTVKLASRIGSEFEIVVWRSLFEQKGLFTGSETEWGALINHYGGQPLALKVVATATQEIFNGKIAEVLKYAEQGSLFFDEIRSPVRSPVRFRAGG